MPEAVIVATARSPIGRAFKGSLIDSPPRRPDRDHDPRRPGQGPPARPGRRRGPHPRLRPARRRAGLQHGPRSRDHARPGQAARHHGHPLLLLLAADHPDGVPRDQGRRGRRVHLRRRGDASAGSARATATPGRTRRTDDLRRSRRADAPKRPTAASDWHDPREDGKIPDVYIAMGQTAENVAQSWGITRQEQDEFGVRSQNLAEKALADGFWQREITPVHAARRHGRLGRRRPPGRRDAGEASPRSSRCSGPTARSPPATAARSTTAPPRSSS